MTHSERIYNFVQYLWGDILEDQFLPSELIDLLEDAGHKLEKAQKLLLEGDPKHNEQVISDYTLIPKDLAKKLLVEISSWIRSSEDNPMCNGRAPEGLYKMRDDLMAARRI